MVLVIDYIAFMAPFHFTARIERALERSLHVRNYLKGLEKFPMPHLSASED